MSLLTSLTVEKSLKLRTAALATQKKSIPDESAIVGNDIVRVHEEWKWGCLLPFVISAMIGGVSVLIYILGASSFVVFSVMGVILVVNMYLARIVKRIEKDDLAMGDARMKIMNTIINTIRGIKIMGWEELFKRWFAMHGRRSAAISVTFGQCR